MTHAELNPGFSDDASMMEFKSHDPAVIRSHRDWRGAVDFILKRLGIALLVLWATWATWTCSAQSHDNEQLKTVVAQREAAYSQLQQQAQAAVQQLQEEIKQLKGGKP